MAKEKYKKIAKELISDLNKKEKEIIVRRFGLEGRKRETLQSIGDSFGITRERVRQIENSVLKRIKPKIKKYQKVFDEILRYFRKLGNLVKEEKLLKELGGEEKNELVFLLSLNEKFLRIKQDEKFHTLWTLDFNSLKKAKDLLSFLYKKFEKEKKVKTLKEIASDLKMKEEVVENFLEISKLIQKNQKGFYGLSDWPEINPRGLRDKAYLIFKELQKPLHFTEIAKLIEGANLKSVHNELIRDERFVLIGRGIYALREWGYYPGEVKHLIFKFIKEEGPLTKEEILERIKKQRIVKENTVLINLARHFEKDEKGRYRIKTAQI
jgi:hypothetical protein